MIDVFGLDALQSLNDAALKARDSRGHLAAGGDPDLFVVNRRDSSLRFFVEVKLEDQTRRPIYRDRLGEQQTLLFPLVERYLRCGVRLAHVQINGAG